MQPWNIDADLNRLTHCASALRALVDELDLGAAEPSDVAPAVELVEQFLLGYLLPGLREVVGPHLIANGAVSSLPSLHGPGEDEELREALGRVRSGLGDAAHAADVAEGARMLARSLEARANQEKSLLFELPQQGQEQALALSNRVRSAYPDLEERRARADCLLRMLELPGFAA